jgi:rRNA maturation protein Nop10
MEKCEKCLHYKSKEKCGECGRLSNAMDNNPMFTPNTNYDRIKSMSVEEMAEWIVGTKLVFECHALGGDAHEAVSKLNNSGKQELDEWLEEEKTTYKQWLLQEVSENDI